MGYSLRDLSVAIQTKLDVFASEDGVSKRDLISSVMADHSGIEGDDADFARFCVYEAVRTNVEKEFRRLKRSEDSGTPAASA